MKDSKQTIVTMLDEEIGPLKLHVKVEVPGLITVTDTVTQRKVHFSREQFMKLAGFFGFICTEHLHV